MKSDSVNPIPDDHFCGMAARLCGVRCVAVGSDASSATITIGRSVSSALAGGGDFRGRGARMGGETRYVLNSMTELLANWEAVLIVAPGRAGADWRVSISDPRSVLADVSIKLE